MASSCLRQVAAPPFGGKTLILPANARELCRAPRVKVHLTNGFLGPALNLTANSRRSFIRKPTAIIAAEAVATTSETEAEAEVEVEVETSTEEVTIVEVEQPEASARVPKVKKTKGLKNIMEVLHKRAVEAATEGRNIPDLRTGDIVQLRVEVPENKKRVSLLRGIVIARHNAGIHTTFRIRRVIAGVGVEMVFPLYSPNIKEIKVVNSRKVRRAKLYYLRDKIARLSTV